MGCFVLRAAPDNRILVDSISVEGRTFMPTTYAHGTKIRRAQGSTLEAVGKWFDRGFLDRGYAYVGSSRVRRAQDLSCATPIRRFPVGEDPSGGEQLCRSVESESCDSEDDVDQCWCFVFRNARKATRTNVIRSIPHHSDGRCKFQKITKTLSARQRCY